MKKILFLSFLFITFYSNAQWNPTGSKTRFVPGIAIGTRDTSWYSNSSDTSILVMGRDSVLYYKYRGFFKPIGSGGGGGATLTLGSGLLGTSYNGSSAVTAKVDTATISTKANVTALLTGYASGASVVKYTDTASMLSSYYNKTATDSRLALKLNISDTAAMLSTHPNTTLVNSQLALKLDKSDSTIANRVTADRVFTNAALALKVNYTDTATMLGNYYNKTATDSRLALKLNISDTATMLSTHPNTTLVNSQLALKLDKSDSTIANRVTAERTFVNAALALKVNYTDTASMLSTHPNTTLVNSLNALNVKYTDTASMLSTHPNKTYVDANVATKQNTLTLTTTGTSGAATLVGATLNIPQYAGGGGGGTVTSVAINNASGLTGTTPITSTGTIGADTSILSTKANVTASLIGYAANALVVKYTDTASMLSTHPNTTLVNSQLALKLDKSDSTIANRVTSDRNFVNASLALKVNYTDTASMLSTHPNTTLVNSLNALNVKYTDTASMLSTHPNKTYVDANVATKQNTVTLTTTGTSGAATFNSSTGALNIPNYATGGGGTTTNALTLGNGLNTGSFNGSAAVTATVDTLLMTTKNWHKKGIDSLANVASVANALKFNISDTALVGGTNYYNKVTVDGKLGLKVNYTDTSSMLGNYTRTANYGITKTGQAFGVDTSAMSTKANVVALLTGYTAGALVVKYTDTASMLSTHPNKTYVDANVATKQNTLTLTTTGTSGAATLVGATLNIPQYSGGGGGTTTNSLTLGSGLTGGSFNGSAAVTATVDTAAFKIATKTDIKDDYTSITQSSDSTYFLITSKSGLQVDTVRLRYTTLTGGGGGGTPSDMSVAQVTRSTTYNNTSSYVDLTFDVNNLVNATADINHSTSTNTNRFTIGTTGVYSITYSGTISPTTGGTNNTDIEVQLLKNGSTVITNSYLYAENSSADLEQWSKTIYVSLTAGDYFTVQTKYLLAASTLQNAAVAVAKMSGTTGATGATGAASFTNTGGITAAGTNQATATLLTTKINDVSTTASGTGVRLPPATVSDYIVVINHGSNPLNVYPATGETVEGGATNAPFVLLEGQSYEAGVATAGAWVGINVNVYDDENTSINLGTHASSPPAPSTGSRIFAKNIGGRSMAAQTGPSGVDYPFQPHTGRNKVVQWQPIGNATTVPIVDGILAPTALGTATSRTVATTNIATRMKRLGYVSAATAGAFAGHFFLAGAQQYTIGDGAGLGGFHYIERFVVSDAAAVSGARQFIGWRSVVTTPTNVEPSSQTNCFGLAQLSTDNTQWYIVYGGSSAQTAIALGTTLGAPTLTNTAWDISFFAPPNSNNTVKYTVTNLGSNVTVSGTLTGTAGTALPSSTTLLAPIAWRCNNATLLAVGLDISSMYIETDQ